MIIQEGLKVAKEVLGPTMQDGDREGCPYEEGRVKIPASFHQCWKVMAENGWISMSGNPEFGGQGLPACLSGLVSEFFVGGNMAFMTYPGWLGPTPRLSNITGPIWTGPCSWKSLTPGSGPGPCA